ncbi:hypothetical protein HIR68_07635 [Staphylococcus coagulans]|uniref:hypothetical protein n=1 Tax=Staphylococcus coagulans TaxID=74706 RepID=UPI001BE5380A|nr:hypothetical protein [Staphylococcus coagulans]MBT2830683.1 hypothetical protein [Staphylococcus coagulans]MBT2860235.1 hypothetical protein [Staphylococcus coagulans]MBU3872697.1 hypothetical protein [Staphylococcus coagulans]
MIEEMRLGLFPQFKRSKIVFNETVLERFGVVCLYGWLRFPRGQPQPVVFGLSCSLRRLAIHLSLKIKEDAL